MDIVFLTSGMAWKFVVRCHDDLRMFDSVKTKHDKLDDSTTVFFSYSSDIPWFNISISAICFLLRSCFKPKSEVGLDRLEKKWGLQLKGAVRYFHCTCGLFSFNPMSLQPLEPCSFHKEVGAMYCFLGLSFWAPNLKTAAKSVASVDGSGGVGRGAGSPKHKLRWFSAETAGGIIWEATVFTGKEMWRWNCRQLRETFLCRKPVERPCLSYWLEALGRLRLDKRWIESGDLSLYVSIIQSWVLHIFLSKLPLTIIRPRLIGVGDCTTPLM